MARPTIRDNGVPLSPGERQKRWRRMKRLLREAALADKREDEGYDAMKAADEAAFQAAMIRDGFKRDPNGG